MTHLGLDCNACDYVYTDSGHGAMYQGNLPHGKDSARQKNPIPLPRGCLIVRPDWKAQSCSGLAQYRTGGNKRAQNEVNRHSALSWLLVPLENLVGWPGKRGIGSVLIVRQTRMSDQVHVSPRNWVFCYFGGEPPRSVPFRNRQIAVE